MAETIGDRLRRIRRDAALTQEQLAAGSGVSKDLIGMLEQNRRLSARITTLVKLATALDVSVSELLDRRPRLDGGMDASVTAVKNALLSPDELPGFDPQDSGEPTPPAKLRGHVDTAWQKYWNGAFREVTATLPGLIGEARHTYRHFGATASGLLAQTYQLTACLLTQMGKPDIGTVGAERAVRAAAEGDDELQWAVVHSTYAWTLLHQARLQEAERLAATIAARIEPSFSAPADHVAVWGDLLMSALAPAATSGRDVAGYISMAAAGAERLGGPHRTYQTGFGPTTVHMQATYAYAVRKDPGKALTAAQRVRRHDLKGISEAAHLLDVAQAQADARRHRDAVQTLLEARHMFPLWFRHQSVARSVVAELVDAKHQLSPGLRGLARELRVDG